ncbi:MAG: hypothetical protein KGN02_01105 [bacterium]|nr:hypothetical protein [bacterium]
MSVIVGVDAGGSSTNVVAMRDELPLGTYAGDPANVRVAGIAASAACIAQAVGAALGAMRPDAVFVGAAGAGRDDVAHALRDALAEHLRGTRIGVSDDARIALRAGVPEGDALALVAGTGTIACAVVGERFVRCGGYGHLLGDEGSGYAIGAAALRLLLKMYDGRAPHDAMLARIAAHLHASQAQDVLARIYEAPAPVREIAAIAPFVLDAATAGERSATKIVQAAALDLYELLKALVRAADVRNRELPLVLAGGLLASNSLLSFLLETRISNEMPFVQPLKAPPRPEYGALALARALLVAEDA